MLRNGAAEKPVRVEEAPGLGERELGAAQRGLEDLELADLQQGVGETSALPKGQEIKYKLTRKTICVYIYIYTYVCVFVYKNIVYMYICM